MADIEAEHLIRQLRYRLKRQGMLELDVWLSPLQQALEHDDSAILEQVEIILRCEVPELLAMQSGQQHIPKELEPWLNTPSSS